MHLNEDGTVTLRPDEQKYLLAGLLHARVEYAAGRTEIPHRTGLADHIESGLSLSLFGDNSPFVDPADATQLANEAYAEWRRG